MLRTLKQAGEVAGRIMVVLSKSCLAIVHYLEYVLVQSQRRSATTRARPAWNFKLRDVRLPRMALPEGVSYGSDWG